LPFEQRPSVPSPSTCRTVLPPPTRAPIFSLPWPMSFYTIPQNSLLVFSGLHPTHPPDAIATCHCSLTIRENMKAAPFEDIFRVPSCDFCSAEYLAFIWEAADVNYSAAHISTCLPHFFRRSAPTVPQPRPVYVSTCTKHAHVRHNVIFCYSEDNT
jgi:hypothetical protein